MKNQVLLNQLVGISPSIKDATLRENFTKTVESLKRHLESMENEINALKQEVSNLKRDSKTSDERGDNVFGKPKTLEEEMKMELLYEIYKKYSLTQIEEKIGNKYNLVF
jgi:predicted RNase H-like nuclease (RuvC/YqgF family)